MAADSSTPTTVTPSRVAPAGDGAVGDARDMRSVLLTAALSVLRRDGAAGLTVRAITQEAGCSTTGVYTYFGGKHGLVEAIFSEGFDSFDREVFAATASDAADPGRQLLDAGRAYRRWALANPTHYMVMFGRAVPDFEPSAVARARAQRSFDALVAAVAATGVRDPQASAYRLYATVHGYVMLELAGLAPDDPAERDAVYEHGLAGCANVDAWNVEPRAGESSRGGPVARHVEAS